ncbi:MAG: T9SS type A sorting domain-containing protein [Chitinophagales bacterium]
MITKYQKILFCLIVTLHFQLVTIAQWNIIYSSEDVLTSVDFYNSEFGIIGGPYNIFLTYDGGETWIDKSDIYDVTVINKLAIIDDTTLIVATTLPTGILASSDSGLSWNFINAPSDVDIYREFEFFSKDTIISLFEYFPFVCRTYSFFDTLSCNVAISPFLLFDISFPTSQVGYVCGQEGIYRTLDGILTWEQVFNSSTTKIQFINPTIGFALYGNEFIKTVDYGNNWSTTDFAEEINPIDIEDFTIVDDSVFFIIGTAVDKGKIVSSYNNGTDWIINDIPTQIKYLFDIDCLNKDTCYAIASSFIEGVHMYYLLKTTNGGGISTLNNQNPNFNFNLNPNPATTILNLQLSLKEYNYTIQTFNLVGELIPVNFQNNQADISHLPPGIYFTEVITEEGRAVQKWVKL